MVEAQWRVAWAAPEQRINAAAAKSHCRRVRVSMVEFIGFPAGPGTPPGVKGAWTSADVEAVLKARFQ